MFITAILTLSYFREFTLRKSLSGVYRVVFRMESGSIPGELKPGRPFGVVFIKNK